VASKRERELARQRIERRIQRREEMRSRRRRRTAQVGAGVATLAVIGAAVALAVILPGGPANKHHLAASASASPSVTPTPTATAFNGTCTYSPTPASEAKYQKVVGFPPVHPTTLAKPQNMTVQTNRGTIVVRLLNKAAPCTVNSFAFLASKHYFNGTTCPRLTTTGIYVLQCGSPLDSQLGGPGYEFANENTTGATYPAGTLAMANSGPGTNGSQFFFVWKNGSQLSPAYSVFGRVIKGLSVLTGIAAHGSNNANGTGDGKPKETVIIEKLTVTAV
jgi:peptidyl-prolyl cis-trans isomerase B (cyclophilin B)